MPEGPAKGLVCRLDEMLDDSYEIRGWIRNGMPAMKTLDRLGLA
jgi:aldehyde:ferredoxin oxidoreductase